VKHEKLSRNRTESVCIMKDRKFPQDFPVLPISTEDHLIHTHIEWYQVNPSDHHSSKN